MQNIVYLFEDSNLCSIHAHRLIVQSKDAQFVCCIRGQAIMMTKDGPINPALRRNPAT